MLDHRDPAAKNRHAVALFQGSLLSASVVILLAHPDQNLKRKRRGLSGPHFLLGLCLTYEFQEDDEQLQTSRRWAELQFMAKAAKFGLRSSKPWGGSARYDMVIETGGRFLRVQIKSTMYLRSEGCYLCGVRPCKTSKPYCRGEFDFVAAYVIPEDVWYIIPARVVVHGKRTGIPLHTCNRTGNYEAYREAWDLLR